MITEREPPNEMIDCRVVIYTDVGFLVIARFSLFLVSSLLTMPTNDATAKPMPNPTAKLAPDSPTCSGHQAGEYVPITIRMQPDNESIIVVQNMGLVPVKSVKSWALN